MSLILSRIFYCFILCKGLPVEDRMKLGLDKILEGFETEHAAGNKDFKEEKFNFISK